MSVLFVAILYGIICIDFDSDELKTIKYVGGCIMVVIVIFCIIGFAIYNEGCDEIKCDCEIWLGIHTSLIVMVLLIMCLKKFEPL